VSHLRASPAPETLPMAEVIIVLHYIQLPLRIGLALVLVVTALLALISWLERTRRLSAFGALSRFARRLLDRRLRRSTALSRAPAGGARAPPGGACS
jgi:hypothetical protein